MKINQPESRHNYEFREKCSGKNYNPFRNQEMMFKKQFLCSKKEKSVQKKLEGVQKKLEGV